jgi:hypothetical protein
MFLKAWRFATLLLASLALTMTSAHVLELPQKLEYEPELYATVNTTLYRYFAIVGGAYTVSAIVAAAGLAYLVRGRGKVFRWTLAGAACLVLAFISWLVLVQPVNREIARAWRAAPESVPGLWTHLRWRWEIGHLVGFVIQLLGYGALLVGSLMDGPDYAAIGEARRRWSGRVPG